MNAGDTPEQIVTWLEANDATGDSSIRQYGVTALVGNVPHTAAYTGSNCTHYASHIIGKNYTIQGNILLGQKVLDAMEARFNRTTGSLACKLMAALQGAKMVGADTRCAPNNTSSLFAFLKVSRPTDAYGHPYINVGVRTLPSSAIEPIDSLQAIMNIGGHCQDGTGAASRISIVPNPASEKINLINASGHPIASVVIRSMLGANRDCCREGDFDIRKPLAGRDLLCGSRPGRDKRAGRYQIPGAASAMIGASFFGPLGTR